MYTQGKSLINNSGPFSSVCDTAMISDPSD